MEYVVCFVQKAARRPLYREQVQNNYLISYSSGNIMRKTSFVPLWCVGPFVTKPLLRMSCSGYCYTSEIVVTDDLQVLII